VKNEEKVLAELFVDLKGGKKKIHNWIDIATKCKKVCKMYGSTRMAAEKLGVSYQTLRTIVSLLQLPKEVQQRVKRGEILYDAAYRLLMLKPPEKQVEVAKIIANLPSHQARQIIHFAKVSPESDLGDFAKRVTQKESRPERLHVAVIPLHEETYKKLQNYGRAEDKSVEKLIMGIVNEWLDRRQVVK